MPKINKQFFLIFLLIFSLQLFSQEETDTIIEKDTLPDFNNAFQSGEYLKYDVKYGLINGGEAEMIIGAEQIGYDWYYHVRAIAKTAGITHTLFRLRDKYESYFEISSGLPIKATRDISENNYKRYNEILFRRSNNTVLSLKSGEHKVPSGTLDILSAFYYARRFIFKKDLKKGDIVNLTTFFDDELFIIKIKYRKTEKDKTKFGKVECLKFVPVIEKGGTFVREKDMQVWFTNDGNYVPVRIKIKVPVGSLKCELSSYENLKNPFGQKFVREEIKEEE